MTTVRDPETAALMGALVADAAALGLHWIYDPARIAEVAGAQAAFTPLNAAHYDGVPAYFAHGARRDGDLSQYGETLALAMRSVKDQRAFDLAAYQAAYAAHFGPGGAYVGYIDRPTRGTLENLAAGRNDPSGVDDDQLPALAALPAIVVRYLGTDTLEAHLRATIRVTHVAEAAERYGMIFAYTLAAVLAGTPLQVALKEAAAQEPLLQAALAAEETDSVAYGALTGRACHLHEGLPLTFHILKHAPDYASAVETNIRAGGDSCGRAIAIGALAGAAYGLQGIGQDWMQKLRHAEALRENTVLRGG